MVQVGAQAFAVDDSLAIFQAIKIGAERAIVPTIGFLRGEARPRILDDASTFANWRGGEYTHRMNLRGTNHNCHTTNFARLAGLKEGEKIYGS